jgi:hypothetical protein
VESTRSGDSSPCQAGQLLVLVAHRRHLQVELIGGGQLMSLESNERIMW